MRFAWLFCLLPLHAAWGQEVPPPEAPAQVQEPLTGSAPPLVRAPGAEPPPPVPAQGPPVALKPGMQVRIGMNGGQSHSGELVHLLPDSLSLQTEPGQVLNLLLTDVQRLERKSRSAEEGAVVGFGVGGLAGGIYLAVLCDQADDNGANSVGGCASLGSLLGGLLGAGAGALIGLMVPHWSTLYEKRDQGPLSILLGEAPKPKPREPEVPRQRFVGELGLGLGLAQDRGGGESNQGWGGRVHLLALLGPHVALGPEAAWYSHIGSRTTVSNGQRTRVEHSLLQLGGLLRAGTEFGPAKASLLGGVAFYNNQSGHAGASVGGAVEMPLWEALPPLAVEVRYHVNLSGALAHSDPDVLTISIGSQLRW
ncbi:hypothetical protein [Stigmatella aurantiaca]|uniref:Uncharacterized protein n=1 Tax=Stigmatella aurantiaca (strain DW4/3-1) TaxID=378806 RepID=Q094Q2_STIAD|nr:hypothetical protein [Stigmatella aurantiaca]ADO75392.1 uncharacterized protein STAUR_7637 [Stigmatella aurantiaca DW4/3-1]EAU67175.1 hypothetical protein STIAU_5754 [Stigmatella aurantiaca DW4/3-1]